MERLFGFKIVKDMSYEEIWEDLRRLVMEDKKLELKDKQMNETQILFTSMYIYKLLQGGATLELIAEDIFETLNKQ